MTDAITTEAGEEPTRRDFIHIAAGTFAAVGAGAVAWPFIAQMNPARDTLAFSTYDVDLADIASGEEITVMWRGKPVFVRHRSAGNIDDAVDVSLDELKDPQTDEERLYPDAEGNLRPEFLVVIASCTHLGCVPLGDEAGDYGGWFCPCHGSHYDTSGRIRRGPAPSNLEVPDYEYLSETLIRIGSLAAPVA